MHQCHAAQNIFPDLEHTNDNPDEVSTLMTLLEEEIYVVATFALKKPICFCNILRFTTPFKIFNILPLISTQRSGGPIHQQTRGHMTGDRLLSSGFTVPQNRELLIRRGFTTHQITPTLPPDFL